MRLNEQSIEKLRKELEQELYKVPEGTRIDLDQDLLDRLLFKKIEIKDSSEQLGSKIVKLPVWSGSFLSKLDLSKVDFENVSWSLLHRKVGRNNDSLALSVFANKDEVEKLTSVDNVFKPYIIDYSNTNANIDFSKSFEMKHLHKIILSNCNFDGINLDKDFSTFSFASDCSFRNCFINSLGNVKLEYCHLTKNNLVRTRALFTPNIFTNDFRNTGVSLEIPDTYKEKFGDKLSRFEGCYIKAGKSTTFKRVLNHDELKARRNKMIKKYQEYEQSVLDKIKNQIEKTYVKI